MSLSNSLNGFSDTLIVWIRQLIKFKETCLHVASLSSQIFYNQPQSFAEVFGREQKKDTNDKYCYPSWISGTFLPPTKQTSYFPKQFLTINSVSRN
jgi:hypothetical protein